MTYALFGRAAFQSIHMQPIHSIVGRWVYGGRTLNMSELQRYDLQICYSSPAFTGVEYTGL